MPKRNPSPTVPAAKNFTVPGSLSLSNDVFYFTSQSLAVDLKMLSLVSINLRVILYKNTKKNTTNKRLTVNYEPMNT
jgi:hypothetical protein